MPMAGSGRSSRRKATRSRAVAVIDLRGSNLAALVVAGHDADALPPGLDEGARLAQDLLGTLAGRAGEGGHRVALPPAQQLIDRHAQALAQDVVKRDVARQERGSEHPPALEILAAVDFLPDAADPAGILPTRKSAKCRTVAATDCSRAERPDSPQPVIPSSVTTLFSSWLRSPTRASTGSIAAMRVI